MLKSAKFRLLLAIVMMAILAIFWNQQSDLAYNIAQQRPILLGRYTESRLAMLVFTTLLAAFGLFRLCLPKTCRSLFSGSRQNIFRFLALGMSILLTLTFVDLALRLQKRRYYREHENADYFQRLPNQKYQGSYLDQPEFPFSYPDPKPGFPLVDFTFSTDANGFRNSTTANHSRWLVIGDSFAEGSLVSDQDTWVRQLEQQINEPVYNCGISGGCPKSYLAMLQVQGKKIPCQGILYMLYEGNDFRDSNFRPDRTRKKSRSLNPIAFFKSSPLRKLTKDFMMQTLGSIGSRRFAGREEVNDPDHPLYPVAWLPFPASESGTNYFAFDVKRLEQHYVSENGFRESRGGRESLRLLHEFYRECQVLEKELVVIYVPDKPHILMQEISRRIPKQQLHAFMATRKKTLPEPEQLLQDLLMGCQVREKVIREFCSEHAIKFISLTDILQKKTLAGLQTYYCYDQHWSPTGHKVVADYLATKLFGTAPDYDAGPAYRND